MRRIIFFILIILASCSDDPTKVRNKDTIEREKFIKILADIHTMDALTNNSKYFRKFDANDSVDLYGSIFDKYGVTKAEFDTTVSIYTKQPDIYMEIYDEVILELNYRLDTLKENIPQFQKDKEKKKK